VFIPKLSAVEYGDHRAFTVPMWRRGVRVDIPASLRVLALRARGCRNVSGGCDAVLQRMTASQPWW